MKYRQQLKEPLPHLQTIIWYEKKQFSVLTQSENLIVRDWNQFSHTCAHRFQATRVCLYSLITNTPCTDVNLNFCCCITVCITSVEMVLTYFTVVLINDRTLKNELPAVSCGINPHSFHIYTFLLWAIQTAYTCSHTPECRPVLDAVQLFTSPEDDRLLKHSTLLRPPIQLHILMFSKERKGEKKQELSRWECHLTLSLLDSAIVLWDGMFELSESEFLMTHSKAKSTVPKRRCASHRGKRGLRSKRPQRSQWWIQNPNQKHGCMQEAFCYTNS